jgi:hypothetical protein
MEHKMKRIMMLIAGVSLEVIGVTIYTKAKFYDYIYGVQFNFEGFNKPVGIFLIIVGLFFIWGGFSKKGNKQAR